MGEKKTTLFEINVESFEFSPSPRLGNDLAGTVEEVGNKGSKLGLFGSKKAADEEESTDEDTSSGLFSRQAKEDEDESAGKESEATEVEVEDEDEADAEESGGGFGLVIGLLFLLVVAAVAKKFVAGGDVEEYEEVELSEYEN